MLSAVHSLAWLDFRPDSHPAGQQSGMVTSRSSQPYKITSSHSFLSFMTKPFTIQTIRIVVSGYKPMNRSFDKRVKDEQS